MFCQVKKVIVQERAFLHVMWLTCMKPVHGVGTISYGLFHVSCFCLWLNLIWPLMHIFYSQSQNMTIKFRGYVNFTGCTMHIEYRVAVLDSHCQHGWPNVTPSSIHRRIQTTASICLYNVIGSAEDASSDNRRPCVSHCGFARLEYSFASCYDVEITVILQAEP